jgi:predicted nucleic acid-binding protein
MSAALLGTNATALTLGYLVVTPDQIFSQVPGLQVEDWSV